MYVCYFQAFSAYRDAFLCLCRTQLRSQPSYGKRSNLYFPVGLGNVFIIVLVCYQMGTSVVFGCFFFCPKYVCVSVSKNSHHLSYLIYKWRGSHIISLKIGAIISQGSQLLCVVSAYLLSQSISRLHMQGTSWTNTTYFFEVVAITGFPSDIRLHHNSFSANVCTF